MKLRADLHSHTNLDPLDGINGKKFVKYSYIEALDAVFRQGISVLSFTHHKKLIFTPEMNHQAKKRGILLIPGVEAIIEGCDVVLLNATTDKITTFGELARERRRNKSLFVLAPHPFYFGGKSLGFALLRNISLFDGIEYCHLHTAWFNVPNWLALWVAYRHKKSIVGTSDSHSLVGFGLTCAVIDVQSKTVSAVIKALKQPANVTLITKNVSLTYVIRVFSNFARAIRFARGY